MTTGPDDPNRAYEYPSLENSSPPPDPHEPIDYPASYPPPPPGYPPPYPFPPPYQGGPGVYDPYLTSPHQGTNGQAIGAFVCALIGVPLCFCAIPSLVGIVLGVVAMNETRRTGQPGHGLALAAVIIGAVTLALGIAVYVIGALTPDTGT